MNDEFHTTRDVGLSAEAATLVVERGGRVMADSREVADRFNKRHDNVLRNIRDLNCSPEFRALNFEETTARAKIGAAERDAPAVRMTKDGFMFLVMGWTGAEAGLWKEAYIAQFNAMEEALRRRQVSSELDMKRLGGMFKAIAHKEFGETREELADLRRQLETLRPIVAAAALMADGRGAVVAAKSVKQILAEAGALPKGRNSLNRRFGHKLRSMSIEQGVTAYRDLHSGVWMFQIHMVEQFMRIAGRDMVKQHNDAVMGQGVLPFTGKRRKHKLTVIDGATA